MPTKLDAVVVGTVLGQKDCFLAPPAAVGVLVQLAASVYECGAAEQRAACVALGDAPMLWLWLAFERTSVASAARHARTGAATLGIVREQGCVAAVEVVNLPPQLDNLALVFVSHQLSGLGSTETVSVEGWTCSVV